jgi:hypothetical protein
MLKAALQAQARGFHVFPVAAGAKVPHHLAGSWGQTATNDINQIIRFWTTVDPTANIGIACKPSQLLVVDLDQAKEDWNLRKTEWEYLHAGYGPRVSGENAWDEMAYKLDNEEEDWSATYQVRTGSGGLHLYYRWPAHWPKPSQASPIKGVVDVRNAGGTSGGYVLAEGSITRDEVQKDGSVKPGGLYAEQETGFSIASPPNWIRRLVAEKPQQPKVQRPRGLQQSGLFSWDGLVNSVRNAGEGNRNNSLLWAARAMYSDGAPESEAQAVLGAAAREAGLGDFEIERTIQSAYRIQQQKEG